MYCFFLFSLSASAMRLQIFERRNFIVIETQYRLSLDVGVVRKQSYTVHLEKQRQQCKHQSQGK